MNELTLTDREIQIQIICYKSIVFKSFFFNLFLINAKKTYPLYNCIQMEKVHVTTIFILVSFRV